MIIERYPYDSSDAEDITRHVLAVSIRDATTPPYHTLSLTIESGQKTRPLNYGDQVVVRPAQGLPAIGFAWPVSIRQPVNMGPSGIASSGIWYIDLVGWYDYLSRSDLVLATSLQDRNSLGTVFGTGEDPYAGLSPFQQELERNSSAALRNIRGVQERETDGLAAVFSAQLSVVNGVGPALDKFIRRVARINLAPGLCGTEHQTGADGNTVQVPITDMRGSVRVAYDDTTVEQLSGAGDFDRAGLPARTCEPIMGISPSFQPLFNGSSKIGGVIQGTWGADSLLMEMFPTLEDPGSGAVGQSVPSVADRLEQAKLTIPNLVTGEAAPFEPGTAFDPSYQTTIGGSLLPGAAQTLRRNPILLYRMRPWRVTPLLDWVRRLASLDPGFTTLLNGIEASAEAFQTYQRITWDTAAGAVIEGDFTGLDLVSNDADNETVFVPQWNGGNTQLAYWQSSGFPIFDAQAARLGARVHAVVWPFIRNSEGLPDNVRATLQAQMQVLVAQAAQFGVGMGRFAMGTITTPLRLDIRHGQPLTVKCAQGTFTCYVEAVKHDVAVDSEGATKRKTTTVTFSRGLWDDGLRDFPPASTGEGEDRRERRMVVGIDSGSRL